MNPMCNKMLIFINVKFIKGWPTLKYFLNLIRFSKRERPLDDKKKKKKWKKKLNRFNSFVCIVSGVSQYDQDNTPQTNRVPNVNMENRPDYLVVSWCL